MTGVGWLDWAAFAVFVGLALALGAQLVRRREVLSHRATGLHVVMALGMAAMSQPRFDPLPAEAWMVAFVASAAAAVAVCGRHARSHAALHVAGSLCMAVAFAAGHHGAHAAPTHVMLDARTGQYVTMTGAAHHDAAGLTAAVGDLAAWPVWPVVGAAFAVYTLSLLWSLRRLRHPSPTPHLPDLACNALMAAAMSAMAFTL